jgi:hypothetical protein
MLMDKLETLMEIEGFADLIEMLENFNDGTHPGICTNGNCCFTAYYEPDQAQGWCENCKTNTVQSAMILAGVI